MSKSKLYRPCVGILLYNHDGDVFVGERHDNPGAWQMPQGGIDEDEDIETAAFRELFEETGIKSARILKIAPETVRYDLPDHLKNRLWGGKYAGQEQQWLSMLFEGYEEEIDIHHHNYPEFRNWQWVALKDTLELIVPFKRETYRRVIEMLK